MSRVAGECPGLSTPFKFAFSIHIIGVRPFVNGTPELSRGDGILRGPSMHLTQFSDYGLHWRSSSGCHPGRAVSVDEVEPGFRDLPSPPRKGGPDAHRSGRRGDPARPRRRDEARHGPVGDQRRLAGPSQTEPHFNLVECFDSSTNTCPIAPACGLKHALARAQQAFLRILDEYSLDQFLARVGPNSPPCWRFRSSLGPGPTGRAKDEENQRGSSTGAEPGRESMALLDSIEWARVCVVNLADAEARERPPRKPAVLAMFSYLGSSIPVTKRKIGVPLYPGYGNDSRQDGPLSSLILHITYESEFAFYVETRPVTVETRPVTV